MVDGGGGVKGSDLRHFWPEETKSIGFGHTGLDNYSRVVGVLLNQTTS